MSAKSEEGEVYCVQGVHKMVSADQLVTALARQAKWNVRHQKVNTKIRGENHHEVFAVLVLATPGVLIAGRLHPPPPSLASPSRAEAQQPAGKVGTCSTRRRACTCVGGLPWEACERRRHSDEAGTPVPLDVNEAEATQEEGRGEVRVEEL